MFSADIFTVFKVAALYDAARKHPRSRILWLDTDTWFQRSLDSRFMNWCNQFDVVTISRKRYWPDTGIAFYAPVSRRLQLLESARSAYSLSKRLNSTPTIGFNDVQVLGQLMSQNSMLRVGHFAVGCRPERGTGPMPQWVSEARPYKVKPRQHYCPNETPRVSPFNLFEYITHKKHHAGPMANRHLRILDHRKRHGSDAREKRHRAWSP